MHSRTMRIKRRPRHCRAPLLPYTYPHTHPPRHSLAVRLPRPHGSELESEALRRSSAAFPRRSGWHPQSPGARPGYDVPGALEPLHQWRSRLPLLCAPRGAVTHWAKLGWRRAARQAAAGPCCYIRVVTGCGGRGRRSATSIPLSKPFPRREGPLKAGAAEPTFPSQFPSRRHWGGARGCWDPADPDSRARRRPLETVSSPGAVPVSEGPRRRISPPARRAGPA